MKIVFSDLDGTLLNTRQTVSSADMQTLEALGRQKIIRVIATGRSYFSLQKVLKPDFPVDYIILSSGVGIIDWRSKTLIQSYEIPANDVQKIAGFLISRQVDFMVHAALPDNHWFSYVHTNQHNADFKRRLKLYAPYASALYNSASLTAASQFVLIFPEESSSIDGLRSGLKNVNLIRATSPLDNQSVWYELLPKQASKRQAAQFICERFQYGAKDALALGNDYNDNDLLDWAGQKFVVANAPHELKKRYPVIVSNNESPLTYIMENLILT